MSKVCNYGLISLIVIDLLLEATTVRYENERRYKGCRSFQCFNIVIFHLSIMDVKIDDENKVVNLLCTLADSWGQVVFSIIL